MIKEKHEKGPDSAASEEPCGSDKDSCASTEARAPKPEEEPPATNNGPKREQESLDDELSSEAFGVTTATTTTTTTAPPPHPTAAVAADGVQPLPSNVINKQSGNMEVHYMQQQSQIFVFTTMMANAGAEEVIQGHYQSIIAYHCAQPGTKKYLEKNPLKVNQFNRQSAPWMNNLNLMKSKGYTRSPTLGVKGGPPPPPPQQQQQQQQQAQAQQQQPPLESFLGADGLDEMVGLADNHLPWDQKNNHHLEGLEGGVKVPDENLTPEQRQHREEQLATVRKLQEILFPENQGEGGGATGDNADNLVHAGLVANNNPNHHPNHPGPPPPIGPGGIMSLSAQLEWQKLQQQYYDDHRKMKTPVPMGQRGPMSCAAVSPSGLGPGGGGGGGPGCATTTTAQSQSLCQAGQRVGMGAGAPGPASNNNGACAPTTSAAASGGGCANSSGAPASSAAAAAASSVASAAASSTTCSSVPGGQRLQGPPPPYHQTQRSASVPVALPSPNPSSPNNPTSNLSLPSPRASSALNSPAEPNRPPPFPLTRHMSTGQSPTSQGSPTPARPILSNPGTPVSAHLSPSVATTCAESSASHQTSVDGMFGRTLQSMAQQKQLNSASGPAGSSIVKEPSLMPVPSPQQIQYLNTFEAQELIIQKQPNTSLKEGNVISPPGFPSNSDLPSARVSGPNTPTTVEMGRFPPTPGLPSDSCRFQIPSPHTPNTTPGEKQQRLSGPTSVSGLSPQTVPGPGSDTLKGDLFPTPSPHMMDVHRFPGPNLSPGPKMGGNFVSVSPNGKPPNPLEMPPYRCQLQSENMPLHPNSTRNSKITHFDPISSLAQMSQQLTNSVASSLNGQGGQNGPGGMMGFGSPSMHMLEMGGGCHGLGDMDAVGGGANMLAMQSMQGPPPPSQQQQQQQQQQQSHAHAHAFHPNSPMGGGPMRPLSPKLSGAFSNHMAMPRMMGRPAGGGPMPGGPGPGPHPYNGANVQVKPNAPNTIQYLPAKSQMGGGGGGGPPGPPRAPPSLDFLRFANPLANLESKMPTQNLQYFPNCGGGMQQGGPPPPHPHMVGHMEGPPDGMGGPMGAMMQGGPMGMGPMMRGGPVRAQGGMMRMAPQMGGFGGGGGPPDVMFNAGGGPPNAAAAHAQMFVSGPKGSPMGLGAPDASQPLPPSMGQSASFKNSQFVGPTPADPIYAQQYHSFQQQLYSMTTRNQMGVGGQVMGPGPGPPHAQQPPYFNPK